MASSSNLEDDEEVEYGIRKLTKTEFEEGKLAPPAFGLAPLSIALEPAEGGEESPFFALTVGGSAILMAEWSDPSTEIWGFNTNFRNLIGTSRDRQIGGKAWSRVWQEGAKKFHHGHPVDFPSSCTYNQADCTNGGLFGTDRSVKGGHVLKGTTVHDWSDGNEDPDRVYFIVPICAKCNANPERPMFVNKEEGVEAVGLKHFKLV